MKKTICVLIAALMIAACLAGCGTKTESGASSPESESITFMTINETDISQRMYEYFLDFAADRMTVNNDGTTALTADDITDSVVEQIRSQAISTAISFGAIDAMAKENNITVTQAELDQEWASFVEQRGGEEEVLKELTANNMDRKIVDQLTRNTLQLDKLFVVLYGENGEKLTDEQAQKFLDDNNVEYLMAKHILLSKTKTDENGQSVDLTEEEKAAKLAEITSYLDELRTLSGDALTARFDELMKEHSEDPGSTRQPDGYLFQEGNMATEFYEGTRSIKENEVSDVVESTYGYHIILRLPIDFDAIPSSYTAYVNYGYDPSKLTLRYIIANTMINGDIQAAMDAAKVTNSALMEEYDEAGHLRQYLKDKAEAASSNG